jgi:polyphosphate kinase
MQCKEAMEQSKKLKSRKKAEKKLFKPVEHKDIKK